MSPRVRLGVVGVVLLLGALIGRIWLGDRFEPSTLVTWLREAGNSAAALPLFFLLYGVATTLFLPAVALVIAAGVTWGGWPGWLIAYLATNLWVHVHFLVGRWAAQDTLREFLQRRGVKWLTRELDQGGIFTTMMIRQLPLPFLLVNLSGGASPMPWWRWAVGNAIGLLPNCIIYTQLASALADGAEGAKQEVVVRIVISSSLVILTALITRWLSKRFWASRVSVPPSKETV